VNVETAHEVVAATDWDGDMRINMANAISAGRVLSRRVKALERQIGRQGHGLHPFIPWLIGVCFRFCSSMLVIQITWDVRYEKLRKSSDAKAIEFLKDSIVSWEHEVRGSDER